jgi:hypothetical protein
LIDKARSDIRQRNRDYQVMQEGTMRALIDDLRRGAPRNLLLKHSFLG